MGSLDVLYYSLSVGFLLFACITSYAIYNLAMILKSIRSSVTNVESITSEIKEETKQKGIAGILWSIVGSIFSRGGEKDGKKREKS